MATFAEIRARVERRVIDLPAATAAEVPILINAAIRKVQSKHNWRVMEAELSTVTVLDQRLLAAIPADWKEQRGTPYGVDNLGGNWALSYAANRNAILTRLNTDSDGRPVFLLQAEPTDINGATNLEVWPLPDGISDYPDGEYRVYIPYWRWLPKLVSEGDSNWFTDNLEEFIVYHAAKDAFGVDWDEERMAVWAQAAAGEYADVLAQDKKSRLAGFDTLVPVWKGARGFEVSR